MSSFIAEALAKRRTLEQAIADLRASDALEFRPGIAEMIRHGEAEIRDRTLAVRRPDPRRWVSSTVVQPVESTATTVKV